MTKKIPVSAIRKHKNISHDIWIVVDSVVWDITEFAPIHPGGAEGL
jgi:L-lactate dehydrogenase (cytochrome)